MAASLTASIASLVLTLDDPNRDDLDSVIVWASTTSGFTPSSGDQVFQGKSLKITIPNLTPGTTYYVKYAYVSTIDTSDYVISSQLSGVPSGVDGSVISDSAITLAKFASGLKPVEIVSTLPSSGNTQGRTVFLTTDNKLYRYNGTAFVSTVPSADLTGQITSTQITDNAITTAKIAANAITANELAANAVTAGKIAAAAVSTTELAANAVTAAKIAAGTITATEIASGAISSDKIAANAITAGKIDVTALRGKTLAGGVLIDGGAIVSTAVTTPANIATTISVSVDDTTDFPSVGAAIVLSKNSGWGESRQFRYTGKTSTSLTGVSGLEYALSAGDIVVPQPFPCVVRDSLSVANYLDTSPYATYLFRRNGGTALAISETKVASVVTYTQGHTLSGSVYSSVLSGVSGLSAFAAAVGSRTMIIDLSDTITTTIATSGNKTTITIGASTSYLRNGGGSILLASTTVVGITKATYSSYSGTTINLSTATYLAAGTYYVIPLYSYNVVGSDIYPLIDFSNYQNGVWQRNFISSDKDISNNSFGNTEIYANTGVALSINPSDSATGYDAEGLYIGAPNRVLHMNLDPVLGTLSTAQMYSGFYFGAAYQSGYANPILMTYDGVSLNQYQPISSSVRFNNLNVASADEIAFDDATNIFSFNADGGTANGKIASGNIAVSVADNTTPAIAIAQSGSADALRVTNTGAGNSFVVEDSANPDASPFVIDTVGNVVIGNTSTTYNFEVVDRNSAAVVGVKSYVNNGNAPSFRFDKARGGSASGPTVVTSGDNIGLIQFYGYDGAAFIEAARIEADVGGATGLNDMPGRLMFFTTPDGSSSSDERMRIRSDGNIGIGGIGSATTSLSIQKAITGGTSAVGAEVVATIQSDVTSGGLGYNTSLSTQAASFFTNVLHYRATQGTFGAGSTVSVQVGFNSTSSLIGATDNQAFRAADTAAVTSGKIAYGFYSAINTATGGGTTYGFYSAGTARNLFSGDVQVFGAGKLGYTTGSGGTATQATSRTTGVTLNKTNGAITLFSTTTTAGTFSSFTVTNNTVDATDTVIVNFKSGATADRYGIAVTAVAAGSFRVQIHNIAAVSVAEAPVINFAVIKAVTA